MSKNPSLFHPPKVGETIVFLLVVGMLFCTLAWRLAQIGRAKQDRSDMSYLADNRPNDL